MDCIEWNINNEGHLLDAMVGHKPVGVNKHFEMALICEKFCNFINRDVDPENIWKHLGTMYNLEALEEIESLPFPNRETEFTLPEEEFGELMSSKEENLEGDMPKLNKVTSLNTKNTPIRESNTSTKETKRDTDKTKSATRHRSSNGTRTKTEETPRTTKRPLRGSLKLEESPITGKSSPTPNKRRRII